jgi:hypothetical protein
MDSRLLVGQLLWCGDGSSLVGAVSYRPRVSGLRSAKNSVRHDVRKYVARIRPVVVHVSGRP